MAQQQQPKAMAGKSGISPDKFQREDERDEQGTDEVKEQSAQEEKDQQQDDYTKQAKELGSQLMNGEVEMNADNYDTLRRMERDGKVWIETAQTGQETKHTARLTESGRGAYA